MTPVTSTIFWASPEANLLKFWFYFRGILKRSSRTAAISSASSSGGSSGTPAPASVSSDGEQAAAPMAASARRSKTAKAK